MWGSINTTSANCNAFHRSRTFGSLLDKENIHSPSKHDDLSMYEANSPIVPMCTSPCTTHVQQQQQQRRPLEDHDSNSQDSGYSASYQSDHAKYFGSSSPGRGSFASFGSSSMCSMDDDFLEDFSEIGSLEKMGLPEGFNSLIEGTIIDKPKQEGRPQFRRALSLHNPSKQTPNSSRVRSCLFRSEETRAFKRPEPPSELAASSKRCKIFEDDDDEDVASVPEVRRPVLKRAFSATEESIMSAVQRSVDTQDLIADFSKSYCLPLTKGRHDDLRSITPQTLAGLMNGDYVQQVASFKIIDCRYPYEFDGGHIQGALNIYTKDQCLDLLKENAAAEQHPNKRNILVFHCEFSSERGPNLYRYLRKQDRQKNEQEYPSLNYPEIYLLEGGYKNFFQTHSTMCFPIAYKMMLHPEHEEDLRHFRQKSKTWNMDTRQRPQMNRRRFARLDM